MVTAIFLGVQILQQYFWVSKFYRNNFGCPNFTGIFLGVQILQEYFWVSKFYRNIFGCPNFTAIFLGVRILQEYFWVSKFYSNIFGCPNFTAIFLGVRIFRSFTVLLIWALPLELASLHICGTKQYCDVLQMRTLTLSILRLFITNMIKWLKDTGLRDGH